MRILQHLRVVVVKPALGGKVNILRINRCVTAKKLLWFVFITAVMFFISETEASAPVYVGFYRGAAMDQGLYSFTDLTQPLATASRVGGWAFGSVWQGAGFDGDAYFVISRGTSFGGPGLHQYDGVESLPLISGSYDFADWHGVGACNGVYYGFYHGTAIEGPGLYLFMDPQEPQNTCVKLFGSQTFPQDTWLDVAFDGVRYLFVRTSADGGTAGIYEYDPDTDTFTLVSGTESYADWEGLGVFDADIVPVADQKAYVLLYGGQSNSMGWGYHQYLLDTGSPLAVPQDDVDMLYLIGGEGYLPENTLLPLQSGNSNTNVKNLPNHYPALTNAPISRFGPELSFARDVRDMIAATNARLGVMKFGVGGSTLYDSADWRPDGTADRAADGPLYRIFQQTAWRTIGAMKNKYPFHEVEVLGMGWTQGESDAIEGHASEYAANLTRFIADIRATFGTNIIFALNKLSNNQLAGAPANELQQWPIVKAAQDAVAAADPLVVATDADGSNYPVSVGFAEGRYHYTTPALLRIGSDLAYAMMNSTGVTAKVESGVVTNGLVAWWKFDETDGLTAVDSHGSNDGTLINFSDSPGWTNDTPGAASSGALFFDGENDVVDCGTAFGAVSNAMTVEVWIKREAITGSWDIYLTKYQNVDNRWYLRVNSDGRPSTFGKSNGGPVFPNDNFYSTDVVASSVWHHVALTASADSNCVWYVDGVPQGAGTLLQTSFANAGKLLVGAYDGAALPIRALMDDVRIYNRALSPAEILRNYRAINVDVVTTNLVSWWKLDESSGTEAVDSQGDNNGTLVNFASTPTWTNDTPGKVSSGALYFDGVANVVDCGNGFESVSNAVTVEMWLKHRGITGALDVFLSKYQDDNNRWYVRINENNTALAYAKQGGLPVIGTLTGDLVTPAVVTPNLWHHMVFTATQNETCHWYVNGKEQASGAVNDLSFANTANLLLGAYRLDGYLAINAVLDDVRVYNYALTSVEVQDRYRETRPLRGSRVYIQ